MCLQWTRVLYSLVIILSNPPISQFNSPCNKLMSVWSMFVYNIYSVIRPVFYQATGEKNVNKPV